MFVVGTQPMLPPSWFSPRVVLLLATLPGGCASTNVEVPAPTLIDAGGDEPPAISCPAMPAPRPFVRTSQALPLDDALRVNHLQAKATHNSYHLKPKVTIDEWDYEHVPLADQLETQGVRAVELDVQWDRDCSRFRVFHIGILDERTTCAFFTDCLEALRGWSGAHPGHHPIFVHIEPKFGSSDHDAERLDALEHEILAVFDKRWLIVPDDLKGTSPSIAQGLSARGWPTLGEARGRFIFYLNDSSGIRDVYTHQRKDLDGRLLFAEGAIDEPYVAIQISNDPVTDQDAIASALGKNLIVRTRADSSSSTAKAGDVTGLDAALASGAQIISTDFPAPVAGIPYFVTIPGGTPSRCAPGVAPASCTSLAIEDPAHLAR